VPTSEPRAFGCFNDEPTVGGGNLPAPDFLPTLDNMNANVRDRSPPMGRRSSRASSTSPARGLAGGFGLASVRAQSHA
jgi:hypothetical protein